MKDDKDGRQDAKFSKTHSGSSWWSATWYLETEGDWDRGFGAWQLICRH